MYSSTSSSSLSPQPTSTLTGFESLPSDQTSTWSFPLVSDSTPAGSTSSDRSSAVFILPSHACSYSRCRSDGLRASLGYGAPLALSQRASEIDICLLCRLTQKSPMNMTERTVKVIDVNIYVKVGGFHPRGDCSSKSFVIISGHTVPTQHIRPAERSAL